MNSKNNKFYGVFFGIYFLVQEAFIGPILVVFYTGYLGFSFPQMTLFFSIILLSTSIFELPCGVLSDIFGRKLGLVLGETVKLLSMGSLLLIDKASDLQSNVMALAIFWGFGNAQSSGNLIPILHEMADKSNMSLNFQRLLSYGQGVSYGVTFLASISAGYLASIDMRIPLIFDIVFCALLVLVCAICLPSYHESRASPSSLVLRVKNIAKEAARLNYRDLIPLSIVAGFFFGATRSAFNFLQPELKLAGISIEYWGWISSGIFLLSSITGYVSGAINVRMMNGRSVAILSALVMGFSFLYLIASPDVYSIIAYLVLCGMMGVLLRPIIATRLLSLIRHDSSIKATLFSIYALILSGCVAVIQTASGVISQSFSNHQIVVFCSVLSIASMVAYSMINHAKTSDA